MNSAISVAELAPTAVSDERGVLISDLGHRAAFWRSAHVGEVPVGDDAAEDFASECDRAVTALSTDREVINAAHEYLRDALKLPANAPRRFDYYAQLIEERARDAGAPTKAAEEPTAWEALRELVEANDVHAAYRSNMGQEIFIKSRNRYYAAWRRARALLYPPAQPVGHQCPSGLEDEMDELTMSDVNTLIGHAEFLRLVRGENDMPQYFFDLARRVALALGDAEAADRCDKLSKRKA